MVACCALVGVANTAAAANLIQNGDFEIGVGSTPSTWNNTQVPSSFKWTVESGTINWISNGSQFGNATTAAGSTHFVDLAGNSNGVLSQVFNTVAGVTYQVSFLYTNNPLNLAAAMTADVIKMAGATEVANLVPTASFTPATGSAGASADPNRAWSIGTFTFVADSTSTKLKFTNTNAGTNNWYGVFVDNVSVTAVPEPSSMALAGLGVAGLIGRTIRRRRQAS